MPSFTLTFISTVTRNVGTAANCWYHSEYDLSCFSYEMEISSLQNQPRMHSVSHVISLNAQLFKLQPFFRRKDDKRPVRPSFSLPFLTLKSFSLFRAPSPAPAARSGHLPNGSTLESSSKGKYNLRKTNCLLCIVSFLVTGEIHSSIECLTRAINL